MTLLPRFFIDVDYENPNSDSLSAELIAWNMDTRTYKFVSPMVTSVSMSATVYFDVIDFLDQRLRWK